MTKNKKNRKNVNPPSKSYKTYFPTKITISFRKVSVNSPYLRLKISSGALKPFLGFLKCDSKICDGNDSKADLILSPLSGAIMPCSVSYLTNGSSSLPLIDPFAPEPSSGNCRASKRLDLQGHRDSGAGSTECSTSEQSDLPSSAIVNVVPSLGVKSSVGDMLVEVSSEAPEFGIPCSHVADVCSPSPPESSSILPHIDFASNPPHVGPSPLYLNNQFSSSLSAEEEFSLLLEEFKDLPSTYSSSEFGEWTSIQIDEFLDSCSITTSESPSLVNLGAIEELLLTSNDLPSLYASTEIDELTSLELEELLEFL